MGVRGKRAPKVRDNEYFRLAHARRVAEMTEEQRTQSRGKRNEAWRLNRATKREKDLKKENAFLRVKVAKLSSSTTLTPERKTF